MKNKFLSISCILFLVLAIGLVSAQYGIPNRFFGSVSDSNGNPAPDGILVKARIDNMDVAATATKDGKYGYNPIFYVPDPNSNRDGKKIEFYVNDVKAGEHTFTNGESDKLDLTASGNFAVTPPPSGGGSGGGGGGGSSGGGGSIASSGSSGGSVEININSPPEDSESEKTSNCIPTWECSDWLDCVNGMQKRVCTDINNCGADNGKPAERRECSTNKLKEILPSFFSNILGNVVGTGTESKPFAIAIIFIVIVLIASLIVRLHFVRKSRQK